jgi:hypothetical protein
MINYGFRVSGGIGLFFSFTEVFWIMNYNITFSFSLYISYYYMFTNT